MLDDLLVSDDLGPIGVASLLSGPLIALVSIVMIIITIYCCVLCRNFDIREWCCCKRFLRVTGHDEFDDFELMIMVHEALFDRNKEKLETVVRVTSGPHVIETDPSEKGIFQQPLIISVEQGTDAVFIELLDHHAYRSNHVLAKLKLDTVKDLLSPEKHGAEHVYTMRQKSKVIANPRIKLTLTMGNPEANAEGHGPHGAHSDLDSLVRLQLSKARQHGSLSGTDMSVLKDACSGPLEMFGGFGRAKPAYMSVSGPPVNKRWIMGIWSNKHSCDEKKPATYQVELTRIQSVQTDPNRPEVFVINYYDETRVFRVLSLRRIDRARDVWVELIRQLVEKVHEEKSKKRAGTR